MAGRFVVLEFDDKAQAELFVGDEVTAQAGGFRPIAMYLKPNVHCECPEKGRTNVANWRKHPQWGLYICNRCKRPSRHHKSGIIARLQYVFGFNILPVEHEVQ